MIKNIPKDKILYEKVKNIAKKKFKVWPSAYGSGWLVKEYKRRGGTYITNNSSTRKSTVRSSPKIRKSTRKSTRKSIRKSKGRRYPTGRKSIRKSTRNRSTTGRKSTSGIKSIRKSTGRRLPTVRKSIRKSTGRRSPKGRKSTGLKRWFEEKWINVCKLPKIVECGRSKADFKNYPYCRPLKRITNKTPKTAGELSIKEINRRCNKKRKNPLIRVK